LSAPEAESAPSVQTNQLSQLIMAARARNYIAAEELAQIVRKIDTSTVDDNSLKEIASLLDSTDGAVRMWVAGALGHFGIRASAYAPRLQQMVSEESCNLTGITAADTAHFALTRMGIVRGPFGCSHQQEQARN
jgi:hypothetical protein